MRILFFISLLIAAGCFAGGVALGIQQSQIESRIVAEQELDLPLYGSGIQDQGFFDRAYSQGEGTAVSHVQSALVAHHLLIADKMAKLFEDIGSDDVKTVVIVGPNHFSVGLSPAQVTMGNYETVYGKVLNDGSGVKKLLTADSVLKNEEKAFSNEHSVYALMPFIKRSFPHAKVIPIIVHETLPADEAWKLGSTIAKTFPGALLIASVDMTHYHDQAFTDQNDAVVMERIEHGWKCDGLPCKEDVEIDSNASMRVLAGFNEVRGARIWQMTDHDSSMLIGATTNPGDNTSHILGYFLK
jgi:AmmeMemoRadiSam system protein B